MRAKILAVALLCVAGTPTYAQTPVLNPVTPLTGTAGPGGSATPVSPTNPFPVSGGTPYQFVPAGAQQSQLSVTTSAVVSLTVPTGTLLAIICIRTGGAAINFSDDSLTTPTTGATGNGRQLAAGQCVPIQGNTLINNFKAIAETTTTAIDAEYDK